jgi:hypothetical protein
MKKVKKQPTEWEKILANRKFDRDFHPALEELGVLVHLCIPVLGRWRQGGSRSKAR